MSIKTFQCPGFFYSPKEGTLKPYPDGERVTVVVTQVGELIRLACPHLPEGSNAKKRDDKCCKGGNDTNLQEKDPNEKNILAACPYTSIVS